MKICNDVFNSGGNVAGGTEQNKCALSEHKESIKYSTNINIYVYKYIRIYIYIYIQVYIKAYIHHSIYCIIQYMYISTFRNNGSSMEQLKNI